MFLYVKYLSLFAWPYKILTMTGITEGQRRRGNVEEGEGPPVWRQEEALQKGTYTIDQTLLVFLLLLLNLNSVVSGKKESELNMLIMVLCFVFAA